MENQFNLTDNTQHAGTQVLSFLLLLGAAAAEGFRAILEAVHSEYTNWLEFLTLVSLTLVIFINLEKAILLAIKYAKNICLGLTKVASLFKLKK